jgi:hypothetical protein
LVVERVNWRVGGVGRRGRGREVSGEGEVVREWWHQGMRRQGKGRKKSVTITGKQTATIGWWRSR